MMRMKRPCPGSRWLACLLAAVLALFVPLAACADSAAAEAEMSAFLASAIHDGMTGLEKLERITAHVANDFSYNGRYSSWADMVTYGGGDCWASSYYILEACSRLGITAALRPGFKDSGAASGHQNVLAEIDGKLYIAEAGISGLFRAQLSGVWETEDYSGTLVRAANGSIGSMLYQYELGQHDRSAFTVLTLPARLMGYPVVELAHHFNYMIEETTTVLLPDTLETIGKYAFYKNTKLRDIRLPDGLKAISSYAFGYCESLGSITIPAGVTKLPMYAFRNCGTLTITVPATVTDIHSLTFYGTDVTMLVEPGSAAESYALSKGYSCRYIEPEEPDVPDEPETPDPGHGEFTADLELPAGLTEIAEEAFSGIAASGVRVPEGVRSIGTKAFAGCTGLKMVYIPATVTDIAFDAFDTPELLVYGPPGSAAEAYAGRKGYVFITTE